VADNVSFEYEAGDAATTKQAFATAAHIVSLQLRNNRIAPVFMEPRSALADIDADSGRLTLHTGSQTAHRMQSSLAQMLAVDPKMLRVVTPDMGGFFGARGGVYAEMALVLIATQRLRCAVKWATDRSESFLTDTQARNHVLHGELAMNANGAFSALRVNIDWRHGTYILGRAIWVMIRFLTPTLGGVYMIPTGHVRIRGVFSNTTPTAAFRGVGRVESTYLMESLIDQAAAQSGLERIAIRQANMLSESQLPYTAVGGARYEACTFAPHLQRALKLAD
jgi:carbon-monoxide dehydrogenase large subunit